MSSREPPSEGPPIDAPGVDAEEEEWVALREAGVQERRRFSWQTTFASMAYRQFVYLWMGQVTHAGALWLEMVARPLLILALTGSAVQLGMVMALRTVASVAFGMVAGVVADNFKRRTVLLVTKTVVLGLSIAFALILLTGRIEIWHIYLFTFLRAIAMAFDQPARRAMIPSIVPASLVTNAMALSTGSMQVMRIAGAAAAGIIVGFAGIEWAFVTIAAIYSVALFFTAILDVPDHKRSGYQGVRSMGNDLFSGLRFAWQTPKIRGVLIIALGYFTFCMAFMQVFAPLFATQVLDIGEEGFGFMMAITGIGGVIGALALATANPTRKRGLIMIVMLMVMGLLLVALSGSTYLGSVPLVFLVVALLGIGQTGLMPLLNASLMDAAPEGMRGRVLGLLSLDRAMTGLGAAIAGFLAAAVGAQAAQIIFGLGCIAIAVVMLGAYPPLRRIE